MAIFNSIACAVCMGFGPDHKDTVAAGYAMLAMLCIIIPMLCAVTFFIVKIARREKENFDPSLSD